MIFVFGSNLAGIHGAGAAKYAERYYGAKKGIGEGLAGKSYAIPTKDKKIRTLPLDTVSVYIERFKIFANANPKLLFQVTRIGCGLAGYTDEQIAPLFLGSPSNCTFDIKWRGTLRNNYEYWGTF